MAQFGGHSQYGGATQFGGEPTRAEIIYAILKSQSLPGFWNLDDATVSNRILAALCQALEIGHLHADRVADEVLPHLAAEAAPDWESLLGIVPAANASQTERVSAIVSAWRGAASSSVPSIREALASVLNPEHEWRDDFADEVVNVEYWQHAGNGTITEHSSGVLRVDVPAANCGWPTAAPYAVRRIIAPTDDIAIFAHVNASTISNANTHGGIIVSTGRDADSLIFDRQIFFGAGMVISDTIRADYYGPGGMQTNICNDAPAEPSTAYWLKLSRAGAVWSFYYGADLADLTLHGTWADQLIAPRWTGLYARNASGSDTYTLDVDDFRIMFGAQKNNVHLHEVNQDEATGGGGSGDPGSDWVFFSSITRWPDDAGTYDILNAQRLADRMAQGHALILVGERNDFRCDDSESLCDRDVMSS